MPKEPIAPKPFLILGVTHSFKRQPDLITATTEAQRLATTEVAAFTTYQVLFRTYNEQDAVSVMPLDSGYYINIREDRNKYTGFAKLSDAVGAAIERQKKTTSMYVLKAVAKFKHNSLYAGAAPAKPVARKSAVPQDMSSIIMQATKEFGPKVACPRCGQRAAVTGAVSLRCDTPACPVDVFLQVNAGTFAAMPAVPVLAREDKVEQYVMTYQQFTSARAQVLYFRAVITELIDAGVR